VKILVTGAGGFVGSALVPLLAERCATASLCVLALPGEVLPEGEPWFDVTVFRGDICSPPTLMEALSGCEVVVHLAGLVSHRQRDRRRVFAVNYQGAVNVAEACAAAGVRRMVHLSSTGAIGYRADGIPADETTTHNWSGTFCYMAAKRAGQEAVRAIAGQHGLGLTVLNPAAIMGPGDRVRTSAQNRTYSMVLDSRVLPTFTGGLAVVDVRDVAEVIVRAIEMAPVPEPCLLVGANPSYKDVLRAIALSLGRKVSLVPVPRALAAAAGLVLDALPTSHPMSLAHGLMSGWHCYYDSTLSLRTFGHTYRSFKQTIADGCRYFLDTFKPDRR
jgi:dihydroflavonol-4-reductase